jgi:hypothetical protein
MDTIEEIRADVRQELINKGFTGEMAAAAEEGVAAS